MKPTALDWIAFVIVLIGALNWGLVGLFSFDLLAYLFGAMSALTRVFYVIVALAGIYEIFSYSAMGSANSMPAAQTR